MFASPHFAIDLIPIFTLLVDSRPKVWNKRFAAVRTTVKSARNRGKPPMLVSEIRGCSISAVHNDTVWIQWKFGLLITVIDKHNFNEYLSNAFISNEYFNQIFEILEMVYTSTTVKWFKLVWSIKALCLRGIFDQNGCTPRYFS